MKTQKSAKIAAVCLFEGLESRQFLTVVTDTTVPTSVIMSDPAVIVGVPINAGTVTDPTLNSDPTGAMMDGSSNGSGTADVAVTDPSLNSDPTGAMMDGSSNGSGTADVDRKSVV